MNTMQLAHAAARAQGLGQDFSFGSGGGFDWGQLIEPISNFGQTFLQAKYAKDAAKHAGGYYPQGQQGAQPAAAPAGTVTQADIAALLAAHQQNPNNYGSAAITNEGIRIGSTIISWPILGLGVGMIFLLQSPGFSRRGR